MSQYVRYVLEIVTLVLYKPNFWCTIQVPCEAVNANLFRPEPPLLVPVEEPPEPAIQEPKSMSRTGRIRCMPHTLLDYTYD